MKFPFTTTLILIFHCYIYISFSFSFNIILCSSNSNYPEDQTTTTIPYVTTVTDSILDITFDSETESTFISSNTIIKALHDGILSTLIGKLANDPSFHTRCLNIPTLPHSYRESLSNYRHLILTTLSLSYPKHKSLQHNISTCESSKRSAYKTTHNHVNSLKSQIHSLRNDIQHYSPSNTYWPLKLQIEFDTKQRALEDYEAELVDYLDRAQSIKRFNCRNWAKGGEGVMTSVYRKMSALSTMYEDLLYCLMSGNKYYYNLVHDSGVVIKTYLQQIPAVFVAVYTKKYEFKEAVKG